jgi:Ca2+-transporting ATPase
MNSQDIDGNFVGVKYVNGQYITQVFESEAALDAVQFTEGYLNVHEQAQTFAFTVLAMSQVFHMVGMTDIKHSFINVFRSKNWMLLVAFVAGFGLQVLVTEVNPLALVFGTTKLQGMEWLELIGLAIVPLVVHEILAPVFRKKNVQII